MQRQGAPPPCIRSRGATASRLAGPSHGEKGSGRIYQTAALSAIRPICDLMRQSAITHVRHGCPLDDSGVPSLDEMEMLNRDIIEKYLKANPGALEAISFNRDSMQGVLDRVKECDGLCAKASVLMCGIAWAQPFSGANKRTAVASAKVFLRRHGLDVDCSLDDESGDSLRRILFEIQERRACLDPVVQLKTQIYLYRHLRRYGV